MPRHYVKDTTEFTHLPAGVEYALHKQTGFLTPNDRFFVCSAGDTVALDAASWRLTIEGDGVARPLSLGYDQLQAMEQTTVPALLECAGNHRRLFQDVLGERLDKRPDITEVLWGLGAVGMAEWRGVRLRDLLTRAGVDAAAIHVCPIGHDKGIAAEQRMQCPMPLAKAMDPDTLIALAMNGEPLPPDHGFPARVIVPGWVGTYSVKWLDRIEVSMTHRWVPRNTEYYVLRGEHWPEKDYAPARGAPITAHPIKSSLALPWPATLRAARQVISGYARSPDACIRRVEWSDDDGRTWREADIVSPNLRYAWVRFCFEWTAAPGDHTLMTRAFDDKGRSQPERVPFNIGGYAFNMIHPHPVEVLA